MWWGDYAEGSPMPRRVYLLGVGLALVALALAFTDWALSLQPGVTERNVRRIRVGMTVAEVAARLGGPGAPIWDGLAVGSSPTTPPAPPTGYLWCSDAGAVLVWADVRPGRRAFTLIESLPALLPCALRAPGPPGVHPDRVAGRHCDHRHPDRAPGAGRPEGPRGRRTRPVPEQPQAVGPGDAQLPRCLQ